jgi:hypothetical protein
MEQSSSWESNRFQLVKKFLVFHANRWFIIAFSRARHLSLSHSKCHLSLSHSKCHLSLSHSKCHLSLSHSKCHLSLSHSKCHLSLSHSKCHLSLSHSKCHLSLSHSKCTKIKKKDEIINTQLCVEWYHATFWCFQHRAFLQWVSESVTSLYSNQMHIIR